MDSEAQSEQPSDVDESFLMDSETTVVFKNDHDDVVPETQEDGSSRVGSDFWDQNDDWKATVAGKIGEKTLMIVKRKEGAGYKLQFEEAGELAGTYSGWYTSFDKAQDAAQAYINEHNAK